MKTTLATFAVLLALVPPVQAAPPCTPETLCEPPVARRYPGLARAIGITVEPAWVTEHVEGIHESFAPACRAFAGCLAVWGNPVQFCRTKFTIALRDTCERTWDMKADPRGWQQCRAVADVFSMQQTRPADFAWPGIQSCAAEAAAGKEILAPQLELDPPAPRLGEEVALTVKAFHAESGFPVYGLVRVEGTMIGPTFEALSFALRLIEQRDDLGRISVRLPVVSVETNPARGSGFPGFPSVWATFTTRIPTTRLTFDPPPEAWTIGANVIRVAAVDEASGAPLEGRIMKPGGVLGDVREPITITLSGDGSPCGSPAWFRPRDAHRADVSLPVVSCP